MIEISLLLIIYIYFKLKRITKMKKTFLYKTIMENTWPFIPADDGESVKMSKSNKYYCESDYIGETLSKAPVYYEGYTYYYKENRLVRSPLKTKDVIIEMNRKFDSLFPFCIAMERDDDNAPIFEFTKDLHGILLTFPEKEKFDQLFSEENLKNVLDSIERLEKSSLKEVVHSIQSLYEKLEFGYEINE